LYPAPHSRALIASVAHTGEEVAIEATIDLHVTDA
jgi:hypothetical protein